MIRDMQLLVACEPESQLSFELVYLEAELVHELTKLYGSVWAKKQYGPLLVWEFSLYLHENDVRKRLDGLIPAGVRWAVISENRVEWGTLTRHESMLLANAFLSNDFDPA